MVIIFSNQSDISTSMVIKWLNYWNVKWIRVNDSKSLIQDFNNVVDLNNLDTNILFEEEISSIWFRRSIFTEENFRLNRVFSDISQETRTKILKHLTNEQLTIFEFLNFSLFSKKKTINAYNNTSINKLKQLSIAKEVGLLIPKSFIVTKKQQINDLLVNYPKLATKPLSEIVLLIKDSKSYCTYTQVIDKISLCNFPKTFFPLYVQQYIEKKFEVRTFYLMGSFYSMAMFTQNDQQTTIDFRKYNFQKPARTVPYKLNDDTENKLRLFMEKLNLNSGSIDIIIDINNNAIFLEVNPVGQFGMVSIPCNYYLEKKIASELVDEFTI